VGFLAKNSVLFCSLFNRLIGQLSKAIPLCSSAQRILHEQLDRQ
jgi:hypothetical protein